MGICIGVIIFGLCINFVNIMDVFPMSYSNELTQGGNTSSTSVAIAGYDFNAVWVLILGMGLLSIPILAFTHSIALIGAYLFGIVFWGAYSTAIGVLLSAGFLSGIMAVFTGIFTLIIGFIFIGAIIGMFTGSG
jgi:hypothetical protein